MESELEFETMEQFVAGLPEFVPSVFEKMIPELELMTGKKAKKLPSSAQFDVMVNRLKRLVCIAERMLELQKHEANPEAAAEMLTLLNRMWRLLIRGIPRGTEPVQYVIHLVHEMENIPDAGVLPQGLDYAQKHLELRQFATTLVQTADETKLDRFLRETFRGHHLIPQLQRAFNRISLPRELRQPPAETSVRSINRLNLGLRSVIADWEVFIGLLYGLVVLKSSKAITWYHIRQVSLWDKVSNVLTEPLLNHLAKLEWVTMRNALDHGSALADPSSGVITFRDTKRDLPLQVHESWREGVDIYLANMAMLRTFLFIQLERIRWVEDMVNDLRRLAVQKQG